MYFVSKQAMGMGDEFLNSWIGSHRFNLQWLLGGQFLLGLRGKVMEHNKKGVEIVIFNLNKVFFVGEKLRMCEYHVHKNEVWNVDTEALYRLLHGKIREQSTFSNTV